MLQLNLSLRPVYRELPVAPSNKTYNRSDPGIALLPQHRGYIASVIRPVVDHMTKDVGEVGIETAVVRMLNYHHCEAEKNRLHI